MSSPWTVGRLCHTVYDRPTVLPFDRPIYRPIDRPTDRPTFTRVVTVADILTDANRYGRFWKDIIIRTAHDIDTIVVYRTMATVCQSIGQWA